jgi:diguanylate cyclase (GGDEF)-like protein
VGLDLDHHDNRPLNQKWQDPSSGIAVEETLRKAGYSMITLLENMQDGFMLFNHQWQLIYLNPAAEKMLNINRNTITGDTVRNLLSGFTGAPLDQHFTTALTKQETVRLHALYHPYQRLFEVTVHPAKDFLSVTLRDITLSAPPLRDAAQRKQVDGITGLPTITAFKNRLEQTLAYANLDSLAVLYIDLDHFKTINDTLGFETGNRLLKEVAKRIHTLLNPEDTACRLYGDKFVCLIQRMSRQQITQLAEHMLKRLAQPVQLDHVNCIVTPSIGISLYPQDGKDADTLLSHAESALFQLKKEGRNRYCFFSPEMDINSKRRLLVGNDLHQALPNRQLHVCYQPLVDLKCGAISGTEALLRWEHPTLGNIPPAEFLPQAEDNGLITEIGQWVLHTACQQTKYWQDHGYPGIEVSVNFSARQLQQDNLPETVQHALASSGLHPSCLHIEITESAMITKLDHTIRILNQLKDQGCRIVIDDFGTYYSSLQYLKNLPVDMIKLDRSFITDLLYNRKNQEIVKSIIELGHRLNFKVVAEGIEVKEQVEMLKQFGCDRAQGYLFSPPLESSQLKEWLDNQSVPQT